MTKDLDLETYLYISTNKFGIYLFDKKKNQNLFENELNFQNEFLLAEDVEGIPLAMTPDLICLLDLETGQPITTETMGYGYRVIVFGLPCDPKWRSKHGLELVGPKYFGYEADYKPIEEIYQPTN